MKYPKVSVVIPSFNRFDSLLNAIESVHLQNYSDYEILVINDASTEQKYYDYEFDKTTKIIHLDKNQKEINGFGPGAIRNFGTEVADGKYLAFLDDDDIWLENKLEKQITILESTEHKFSSTEGYFGEGSFNENNTYQLFNKEKYFKDIKYKYRKTKYLKGDLFPSVWDKGFLDIHNCVVTSSVVVEKKIFNILGGFRGLPLWADYDCWKGLITLTSLIYLDEPLFYYDGKHGDGREYYK